jgi:hypothetical protein
VPFGAGGVDAAETGTALFDRAWAITVDTIKLAEHDVVFKVEKTIKAEPNTCSLSIWNLNEAQRSALEELRPPAEKAHLADKGHARAVKGIGVRIEAGYGNSPSLIWLGDLRTVNSVKDGPDWVTALESGDGEKAWQNARVNVSYGPKTPVDTALRAMVRALGVGEGNLAQVVHKLQVAGVGKVFPRGTVISGPVSQELSDFCRSADLEWSIQDGAIQFVDRGKALAGRAVRLSPDTGMLGSPTVDPDGILTVQMLMIPDVRPGTLLVVNAARVKGNYRVEKATWAGDSAGGDWTITCEAKRF